MHGILAAGLAMLLLLTGCGADDNPVLGKWRGNITEEQRKGLLIPEGEQKGVLIADFFTATARLNGEVRSVEHKKNEETRYINEIGTNRTMAAQFPEPGRMKLMMPHRFKAEIVVIYLTKVTDSP